MSNQAGSILVTGGTSGLGYQCALQIAQQRPEWHVIIASRSDPDSAAASINKTIGQSNVEYLPLDLAELANIRSFVAQYQKKNYPPIRALLLNAGLQIMKISYTQDGIEKTFGIAHVGHALLFYLLYGDLAENARVVITSSGTHDPAMKTGIPDAVYTSAEQLAHPTPESAKNNGRQRYSTSKLCNVMWMYALHRRFAVATTSKKLTVTAFDPGLIPGTGLARNYPAIIRFLFTKIMPYCIPLIRLLMQPNTHSVKTSGSALARLAVGKDVEGLSGVYFEVLKQIDSSIDSHNEANQEDLWRWTLNFISKDEDELRAFERI